MNNFTKTVKTTAIAISGDSLALTIPDMELRHGQHIRICFAQIPPVIPTVPLTVAVIVNGDGVFVFQNRMDSACGSLSHLYSDQLQSCCGKIKARQYIDLIYGSDTESFMYAGPCRCLPRANINFPRVPAPPTPAVAEPKTVKKEK